MDPVALAEAVWATTLKGQTFMQARPPRNEKSEGYALLLVMFFLALLVISMTAATPSILTSGRREKEREMIWRGQQYVRGVRLYYQKTHRLPSQLEDLYLPKTGIRFMRQAYKDPMNTVDGSWRLIYVGPNGQLIGSLNDHHNAFFFGAAAPAGLAGALSSTGQAAAMTPPGSSTTSGPFPTLAPSGGASSFSNILAGPGAQAPLPGNSSQAVNAASAPNPQDASSSSAISSDATQSDDQVFGQTIVIGVGSKINESSFLKYDGANNYLKFEFIWNGSDPTSGTVSR